LTVDSVMLLQPNVPGAAERHAPATLITANT
jgi:hypothetical protein